MSETVRPRIRPMERDEIDALLERNHVGRLAYARGNQVDIEPIHYVFSDGWIYGRTSHGAKIEATGTSWWPVAFEVDEVDDLFDWRSVVVHGGFYAIAPDRVGEMEEAWMRGVGLLRRLIPETLREGDPVPGRDIVFRIAVQEATGRVCTPTPPQEEAVSA